MIAVQDLLKCFGEVHAVDHVTLDLPAGECLCIHGPSGSGKTTLLRLIAGLEMPDEGKVLIDGEVMSEKGFIVPPHERGVGFMFQSPALWPHMTVAQNINFGLHQLSKEEAKKRLNLMLQHTELHGLERRYPSQLSGGQARRVALARTLAPNPKILLMDEPLTNIDPELKDKLLHLIKGLILQEGITMVYVTHELEEARQIAGSRSLEMKMGQLFDISG